MTPGTSRAGARQSTAPSPTHRDAAPEVCILHLLLASYLLLQPAPRAEDMQPVPGGPLHRRIALQYWQAVAALGSALESEAAPSNVVLVLATVAGLEKFSLCYLLVISGVISTSRL